MALSELVVSAFSASFFFLPATHFKLQYGTVGSDETLLFQHPDFTSDMYIMVLFPFMSRINLKLLLVFFLHTT